MTEYAVGYSGKLKLMMKRASVQSISQSVGAGRGPLISLSFFWGRPQCQMPCSSLATTLLAPNVTASHPHPGPAQNRDLEIWEKKGRLSQTGARFRYTSSSCSSAGNSLHTTPCVKYRPVPHRPVLYFAVGYLERYLFDPILHLQCALNAVTTAQYLGLALSMPVTESRSHTTPRTVHS